MITFPCAKINIGLYVTEKRPDGYHNLETVFYPIPLCDRLEIEESTEEESIEVGGIPVAGDAKDNLVMKTVNILREQGHAIPPLRIRLEKNIPSGAGLGGGSSDAAFTLKMLNEMFHLGLTQRELELVAKRLGADCPFFIQCKPVFAQGIGDEFTPIDMNLSNTYLVLVKPDDFISTAEAYRSVTPCHPSTSLLEAIAQDPNTWKDSIRNDFEASAFPSHPTVEHIKDELYQSGAYYAAMSGSGSSVFGLFHKPIEYTSPYFHFCAKMQ